MVRFFVSSEELDMMQLCLEGENAAHAKVLRLKCGEQVLLCDGEGRECLCVICEVLSASYLLEAIERRSSTTEPAIKASVYMALPKADKLEHVIQKATELGAYEIVTFPTARCVSRPDDKSLKKKLERWQKIAASAAEQSGRGRIPQVVVLPDYASALKRAAQADIAILFYENERANTLQNTLRAKPYHSVSLISGPEGGFEESEVTKAMEVGLKVCTLGARILRCETAPLCALSAVMYDSGEF
jgi:16S rRNA (uracil1498-N3)-methyltransferase